MIARTKPPEHAMTRRGVLAGMLAYSTGACAAGAEQAVPNSAGSAPPRLDVPATACDCHHHIYDARFPASPHWRQGFPPGATVADYRLLQRRLGTTRSVVVQPSTYGIDNRCLVDALGQLGPASRGVAVVDTDVKDAELRTLTDAGVRAIRVNFVSPQTWGTTTPEMLTSLAARVSPFGWHVQIMMTGDQIVAHESVIRSLPTKVVIDHLGRIPQPDGIRHPGFSAVRRMLDSGQTWVKVTEPYEDSKLGPPYTDSSEVARAYVQAAPERGAMGNGLATPDPARLQTRRCAAARSARGLGAGRTDTPAPSGYEPRRAVRLLAHDPEKHVGVFRKGHAQPARARAQWVFILMPSRFAFTALLKMKPTNCQ